MLAHEDSREQTEMVEREGLRHSQRRMEEGGPSVA